MAIHSGILRGHVEALAGMAAAGRGMRRAVTERLLAESVFLGGALRAPPSVAVALFRVRESVGSQRKVRLRDGLEVPVREIRPEDAAALRRFHSRLSERSIRLRFFGPKPELTGERARYFAEVDGEDRYALVALDPEDPDEIIGVVRFDRDREDGEAAEYAAVVEDRWQGRGLGSALTRELVGAAQERGVKRLNALVMPGNRPMIRLLRHLDLPEKMYREDGVERVEISLSQEAKRQKVLRENTNYNA